MCTNSTPTTTTPATAADTHTFFSALLRSKFMYFAAGNHHHFRHKKKYVITIQWDFFLCSLHIVADAQRSRHARHALNGRRQLSDRRPKETAKISINNGTTYCLYMDIKIFPHKINCINSTGNKNNSRHRSQASKCNPLQFLLCVNSMSTWFASHMLYRRLYVLTVNTAYAIGICNETIDKKCELRARSRSNTFVFSFGDGTENANSKMDKMIASNRLKIVPIRNGRERQTSEEQSDTHKMSELIPTYIFS